MCGIFGFYLKESLDEEDISLGVSGVNALKHRGPDNQNYWYNAEHGIFLGHTRLSILDISEKSNQPMIDSEHVMVYNGEIYNYKEISKGLSSGEYLKSTGDTEVLFNCWKEYGEKCLAKLDGMYAFAVYNKRERTLDLFSDYFGEKPLYWFESNKGIYFSSELNPLVKLLAISSDFSESDVSAFLSFGFMPGQRTGYKQTKALEPASHLRIEDSGSYNLKKYWTPQERIIENTSTVKPLAEKDIDLFQDALLESLQVRLRSDVPLGLFLSSGLDSSVIASLAKKELNFDIECLTVKFNDPEVSDESAMASKIALFLDLPHKIIDSKDDPARKDRNVIYDLFGEANNNITIAAAYQMSLAARESFKVALCGVGGDEIFFGYNKYHELYHLDNLGITSRIKKMAKNILRGHKNNFDSLNNFMKFLYIKNSAYFDELSLYLNLDEISQYFMSSENVPSFESARMFDLRQTMPFSYIPALERASMRVGLEVRTPFLNRKLFDLVSSYDSRVFLVDGKKDVLRRILSRYLPEKLFNHSKKGFRYPLQSFLKERPPEANGFTKETVANLWEKKALKGIDEICVRMQILEFFRKGEMQKCVL